MTEKRLRNALSVYDLGKKDRDLLIPALLGFMLGGKKTVEVPGRNGFVYARIHGNNNEVVQVLNDRVSPVYDLPVLIKRDEIDQNRYRVDSRDIARYNDWGSQAPYLPRHGAQHSFQPDSGGGGDVSFIYGRQFMPLSITPSGSNGSMNVIVNSSAYYHDFQWKYAGNTGTSSFSGYKPTGSNARMVLVYLDEYGNPQLLGGSNYFADGLTATSQILPYMPLMSKTTDIPLGGIRLVSGTSVILWDNIYDLRPFIVADSFIPTGSVGHTIQDDGVSLSNRSALNFVGNGFVAYDTAGATIVSGTAGGAVNLYDNSEFKATASVVSFDNDLQVSVSGSNTYINQYYENLDKCWKRTKIEDEFLIGHGSSPVTQIGQLGWRTYAGDITDGTGAINHPGVIKISTGLTSGTVAQISLYNMQLAENVDDMLFIAKGTSLPSGGNYRLGMLLDSTLHQFASDGIYWIYLPESGTNWKCVTRNAGVVTMTDSGVAFVATNYYMLRIKRNNDVSWTFQANGVDRATHSTNIPTGSSVEIAAIAETNYINKQRDLDVDYFAAIFRNMPQRWT